MAQEWRLLDVDIPDDPYMNLAIEEAISQAHAVDQVPNTFRFWTNRNAVVLGYHEKVNKVVYVRECKANKIAIVRRPSGGGAVYHDIKNLNYSLFVNGNRHPFIPHDFLESCEVLCRGLIEGLQSLGLAAKLIPPNHVFVNGMKISGNAQKRLRWGKILHHGTLMVDVDLSMLSKVLRPPKGEYGQLTGFKHCVTTLRKELGREIEMEEVKDVLKKSYERTLNIKLVGES